MNQSVLPQTQTATALLVGTDDMLLFTRKAMLQMHGFEVSIHNLANAIKSVGTADFHLIVACHTLEPREADTLVQTARSNPARPALIGFSKDTSPAPTAHPFDGSVWSLSAPEAFISKVHEVLGLRPK